MSSRDTFTSSVKSAAATQVASVTAAQGAFQETINQSGCNVGYNLQTGTYATFAAAVKAANLARLVAVNAAEAARQGTIAVARDTLKATGDVAPT